MLRSESFKRWWPTTQSLDLVRGTVGQVATALETEIIGYVPGETLTKAWPKYANFDEALSAVSEFSNVPTQFLVLPTFSDWSVLWNNSFLCDGYDSLSANLTRKHGLTTVHWSAHDSTTSFQAGASFTHRKLVKSTVVERSVYAARQDSKWLFGEIGPVLPEENTESYLARRIRDRLNESLMAAFLGRLGATPWDDAFYAFAEQPCFFLRRLSAPTTITRRSKGEVVGGSKTN